MAEQKVNLNSASVEELENGVYGMGHERAEAIVNYRENHGGSFGSIDDLNKIEGFDDKLVNEFRPQLTL